MAERANGLLDGYQLRLPVYEGPLDVLLRLIERNQLLVTDVSLVLVTEQFVEYTAGLADASSDALAEFMSIAARLLLLKSRSLLPRPAVADDEEEPDDLVDRLREYQRARLIADDLRQREAAGLQSWPRLAVAPDVPATERLVGLTMQALVAGLRRCLVRGTTKPEKYVATPVISLLEMTRRLLGRLGRGSGNFTTLVGQGASRTEYAVAFIALLSLLRRRAVDASQSALFGEIEIARIAPVDGADD
ncbi:MAG TPA: ScpA family protein [Nitrolancea sp.]|nr:ScpA family protein [Nitrolancea sp.]